MRNLLNPCRIVTCNNCENEEILLQDYPCQTSNYNNPKVAVIKQDGYVLLDFGKEIHGSVMIALQCIKLEGVPKPFGKVRVVYGESVMEALSEIGEKNANNNHSPRDFIVDMPSMSAVPYGETGFRFVKIQPLDADISLCAVKARLQIRELSYLGNFECNEERLNQIWKTAAYTVQLNMQEYLWDGIKRDRLVWIGDMHPEVSTIRWVFGKDECVPRSLDFIKEITPDNSWMNNIPTYSIWWVLIQHDWYLHWGDLEYLKAQTDYLKVVADKAAEWIDGEFAPCGLNLEYFVDWPNRGKTGEKEGVKAIFCLGLECAAKLFTVLEEKVYAKKCQAYAERLRQEPRKEEVSKTVAALMVLAGKKDSFVLEKVKDTSMNELSTFMGGYVLRAKDLLGNKKDALETIRQYWGTMLDFGATTFWEDFDLAWTENAARIDEVTPDGKKDIHGDFGRFCYEKFRHSLCHGWSSGPASFLIEKIAGIEILEPGCKKIRLSPDLAGLEWAEVSFPTPYGCVNIHMKEEQGKTIYEIDAPKEITIIK